MIDVCALSMCLVLAALLENDRQGGTVRNPRPPEDAPRPVQLLPKNRGSEDKK